MQKKNNYNDCGTTVLPERRKIFLERRRSHKNFSETVRQQILRLIFRRRRLIGEKIFPTVRQL